LFHQLINGPDLPTIPSSLGCPGPKTPFPLELKKLLINLNDDGLVGIEKTFYQASQRMKNTGF
jgi:hypothetical protein